MTDPDRRRLLLALAGVPLLGGSLTACLSDGPPKSAPGPRADADTKVRWRAVRGERSLSALHAAVAAAHPSLAGRLAPLAAHHAEHLAALEAEAPLPFGGPEAAEPQVPADSGAALAAVVEAERTASQERVDDCLAAAGGRLAAVLASVAAAEASHAVALDSRR